MSKIYIERKISFVILTALILIISFSGIAATAKAQITPNSWAAQTQFIACPTSLLRFDPTYSPSQIKAAYNLPTTGSLGSGETIAIIDAYNDPTIASDLTTFSSYWGLPAGTLVVHAMSSGIATNGGWALEIALDVEWAHAIAPDATILLVEATSNSLADLMSAVSYAVSQPNVIALSMSWGGSEFSGQTSYDPIFANALSSGIVCFASSGDSGGGNVIWPSTSPSVVSVGGTTLNIGSSGAVTSETAWSGSGGGLSAIESAPAYQTTYGLTYAKRVTPDVSYDANPNTGVYVYDTTPYGRATGWWDVGGTSVGAPQWAAIQALGLTANDVNFYQVAKSAAYSLDFRDITSGSNGPYSAGPGYDLVTGLGSPLTTNFAPVTTPDFSVSAIPNPIVINTSSTYKGTTTITISPSNGFTGTVGLATSGFPSGWTTTLNPTSVTGGSGTSTLTITVPASQTAGTFPVTVTGTSGSVVHSITVNVQVTTPDFSISASPTSLMIRSGYSGTSTITVSALNGFTGTVSLSASSSPSGLTTSFSPTSIATSGKSTLTITVPSSIMFGTYTITVTGTSGSLTHTATISVIVSLMRFG